MRELLQSVVRPSGDGPESLQVQVMGCETKALDDTRLDAVAFGRRRIFGPTFRFAEGVRGRVDCSVVLKFVGSLLAFAFFVITRSCLRRLKLFA
jgi:hypothetical protein